jgi:hypothetical protein
MNLITMPTKHLPPNRLKLSHGVPAGRALHHESRNDSLIYLSQGLKHMRTLYLFLALAAIGVVPVRAACVITLTSPAASAVWTGFTGNTFTSTFSGCPNLQRVQYFVGAYEVSNPGTNAMQTWGFADASTGYSLPANSFMWFNGTQSAYVVAYDALGNALATSASNSFTISNVWPILTSPAPGMTVATGTALGSTWSGPVSVTPTISGAAATDDKTFTWYVDGIQVNQVTNVFTAAPSAFSIDTTQFLDGQHIIAIHVQDAQIVTPTATYTTGSTLAVSSASGIVVGQQVSGLNITYGSLVTVVSGTTITISPTPTGSGTATPVSFSSYIRYAVAQAPEENMLAEWSSSVTFGQGSPVASQLRSDQHDMWLAPTNTHQLAPILYNTDGSVNSSFTPVYMAEGGSIATVSSTGLVTAVAAGAANSPSFAVIDMMAPASGVLTDLSCGVCSGSTSAAQAFVSASHPFGPQNLNQLIHITGGSGWIVGVYKISVASTNGQIQLSQCIGSVCSTPYNPGAGSSGSGTFTTGPSTYAWALVNAANPNPAVYHFGNDGSILSTYTPGKSLYINSGFFTGSVIGPGDQQYSPGFQSEYSTGGFTTVETGPPLPPSTIQTEAAWATNSNSILNTAVNYFKSLIAGYPLYGLLITDSWLKNSGSSGGGFGSGTGSGLFQVTRAIYTPPWSLSPLTYALNAYNGVALQLEAGDEYSDYGASPFEGPINFATGLQIVSTGSSCTATTNNGSGYYISSAKNFVLAGPSSITNAVNAAGSTYGTSSTFFNSTSGMTFNCTIPAGTYNATNNPGDSLSLEPFAINWLNNTTGLAASANDYIRYTVFTSIKSQINAASVGRPSITFPPIGTAPCSNIYGFANPSNGLADYATKYYTGAQGPYLGSRDGIYGIAGNTASPTSGYDIPWHFTYGCWSPTAPLLQQNSSVPANYGGQGYAPNGPNNVVSFVGNVITFAAPHGVPNVLSGITRVGLCGMPNTGTGTACGGTTSPDNGSYFVMATPTATTMTVTNAQTDFIASGGGGTLTFSPSNISFPLLTGTGQGITADGTLNCSRSTAGTAPGNLCGNIFSTLALQTTLNQHRGETFQVTGVTGTGAVGNFATDTFLFLPENPNVNASNKNNIYREISNGTSSSCATCTATVYTDLNFVPGRNGSTQDAQNPDLAFAGQTANRILPGAGTRLYSFWSNQQAYNPAGGYLTTAPSVFGDTGINNQLFINSHWEDFYGRPNFHAIALANLMSARLASYALTTLLPTPDAGPDFRCTARSGAKGKMMECLNITSALQTVTFTLTPYETAGQNIAQFLSCSRYIKLAVISAGTASQSVAVPSGAVVSFLFPVSFAAELQQPVMSIRLADVTNATGWAVRYGYDSYLMDAGNTVVDCGSAATCTIPADRMIGPIYYRILMYNSAGSVLATGDVQSQ